MWIAGRRAATYDLTRFAGQIKTRGLGFFHIVKFMIAVSIIFAILMLI